MTDSVGREAVEPFKKGDFDNLRLPHLKRMLALERNERIALLAERDRLREILQMFVAHYPHGLNPHCDEARYKARAALKGDQT